ncbi:hypothetical protein [Fodinicola acaciae]|uniref:hypothetical protein n=1 Tax=Fodinicola acaciae TaxID=2681555 RepID=UPI0013D08513|nr:hypothetical protein [Fodinicola acaciae]
MKRHELDGLSLVFGLLFVAVACWWAIYQVVGGSGIPISLAAAITLVVIGIAGLLTAIPRRRTPVAPPSEATPVDLVKHDDA